MVFSAAVLLSLLQLSVATGSEEVLKRVSPAYQHAFQLPLPIPAVKTPLATYTNPETGVPIDFYQVEVKQATHTFYPNLGNQTVFVYDGTFPGPTFRVPRGREAVVRLVNGVNRVSNFHVHGSYSRSPWDGWANDILTTGQFKDYYHPNLATGRTLWYHDHSNHQNALNVYQGMFGSYQIIDQKQDETLGLPTDAKYDIPLLFSSHYFTKDGKLSDERRETASIYGDTWMVNGRIQPFLQVEPRKYRFRILNGAVSRTLNMTLEQDGEPIDMYVIGSDGGLRQSPAATKTLLTGMGERWEIIVDFAPLASQKLTLRTTNSWTDKMYDGMGDVMEFRVGGDVSSEKGNGELPKQFDIDIRFPTERIAATREFNFRSHMDMVWGINSYHMDDSMDRVMMRPPLGTIEKYVFRSDGRGGMKGGMSGMGSMGGMGGMGGMGSGSKGNMNGGSSSMSPSASSSSGSMGSMGSSSMGSTKEQKQTPQSSSSSSEGGMGSTGPMGGMSSSTHSSHHGGGMGGMGSMGGMGMKVKRQMMGVGSNSDGHQDKGGLWTHAIHLHLVDMRIVSRSRDNQNTNSGRDYLEDYEQGAVKDVVLMGSNEKVEVLAKYVPYSGLYMFHCHNLVHEDNGMMGVMNVTALSDLGYTAKDSHLENPMDKRFSPQKYTGTDLEQVRTQVLPGFARLAAYPEPYKLGELELEYWADKQFLPSSQTGQSFNTSAITPQHQSMMDAMGIKTMATSATSAAPTSVASATTASMGAMEGMSTMAPSSGHSSHHGGGSMNM